MLKVVKVLLHNQDRVLETYAVLDDHSERSIILPHALQHLNLTAQPETLTLQTVHQDVVQLHGANLPKPDEKYSICQAFTSANLGLSEHCYPVRTLKRRYKHLRNLLLPPVDHTQPLLCCSLDPTCLIS